MNATDFTTDPSLAYLALLKEAGAIPEYVQAIPEPADLEGLPANAFADSANRLLPIHSKTAAFMSAVSAFVSDHPGTGWQDRLKAACHAYDITSEVKRAHALLARKEDKQAAEQAPVRKYALSIHISPGDSPHDFYPISTASQIEDSALKMAKDMAQQRLPESVFADAAEELMKAASEENVPSYLIPASVRELGESRTCSPSFIAAQLDLRTKVASLDTKAVELYKEATDSVLSGDMSPSDGAHFWELADRKFKVAYVDGVKPPVHVYRSGRTHAQLRKEASATVTVGGVTLPFQVLQSLPQATYVATLDKAAAATVLHAVAEGDGIRASHKLASLPNEDQMTLLQLLVESHGPSCAA